MTAEGPSTISEESRASVFLPSFEEAFFCKTHSMTSHLCENSAIVSQRNPALHRKEHPKRSAIKRHLEQEKVLVQPAQADTHHAKKIRSDWDLLFFTNNENSCDDSRTFSSKQFPECSTQGDSMSKRKQSFLVRGREMKTFFHLLEDDLIEEFISRDKCMQITDKTAFGQKKVLSMQKVEDNFDILYLLAMVFVYFKRAGYKLKDYTRMNFFIALYLANDMEEDEEELKYEIFPWALGDKWRDRFPKFLRKRDKLWAHIDHQAVVSRRCCEEIMAIEPDHPMWKRNRPECHGGAVRSYLKDPNDDGYPRGPNSTPRKCPECDTDSQYDSASPDSVSWYVSSGDSSPGNTTEDFFEKPAQSTFDMKGLKRTLQEGAWPEVEE